MLRKDSYGVPRIVTILGTIMRRVAEHNDSNPTKKDAKAAACAFQGSSKPCISIQGYLERIFRYADCSPSCYVVAYIYLDRFVCRNPLMAVDSFNVHRFIITSVLAAVKFMDDIYYNNTYFAKVGGISLKEINCLEVDFLFGVGFELNVTHKVYNAYCSLLQREAYLEYHPSPSKSLPSLSEEVLGD